MTTRHLPPSLPTWGAGSHARLRLNPQWRRGRRRGGCCVADNDLRNTSRCTRSDCVVLATGAPALRPVIFLVCRATGRWRGRRGCRRSHASRPKARPAPSALRVPRGSPSPRSAVRPLRRTSSTTCSAPGGSHRGATRKRAAGPGIPFCICHHFPGSLSRLTSAEALRAAASAIARSRTGNPASGGAAALARRASRHSWSTNFSQLAGVTLWRPASDQWGER